MDSSTLTSIYTDSEHFMSRYWYTVEYSWWGWLSCHAEDCPPGSSVWPLTVAAVGSNWGGCTEKTKQQRQLLKISDIKPWTTSSSQMSHFFFSSFQTQSFYLRLSTRSPPPWGTFQSHVVALLLPALRWRFWQESNWSDMCRFHL